jgi:hypothetical protein
VLDPFCGSGTTLIATERTERERSRSIRATSTWRFNGCVRCCVTILSTHIDFAAFSQGAGHFDFKVFHSSFPFQPVYPRKPCKTRCHRAYRCLDLNP